MANKKRIPKKEKRILSRCLYTSEVETKTIKTAAKIQNSSINSFIVKAAIEAALGITEHDWKR
jgi:uncharacterized protein (DUF1778 family)